MYAEVFIRLAGYSVSLKREFVNIFWFFIKNYMQNNDKTGFILYN